MRELNFIKIFVMVCCFVVCRPEHNPATPALSINLTRSMLEDVDEIKIWVLKTELENGDPIECRKEDPCGLYHDDEMIEVENDEVQKVDEFSIQIQEGEEVTYHEFKIYFEETDSDCQRFIFHSEAFSDDVRIGIGCEESEICIGKRSLVLIVMCGTE